MRTTHGAIAGTRICQQLTWVCTFLRDKRAACGGKPRHWQLVCDGNSGTEHDNCKKSTCSNCAVVQTEASTTVQPLYGYLALKKRQVRDGRRPQTWVSFWTPVQARTKGE
jgi:hypothetical protein